MAEPIVVTGLLAKRAEMAGLIDHHRKRIAGLQASLVHLDATINLFAPEIDLRTLRPKQHRERNHYFRPGEAPRAILDALRLAGKSLTSRELSEQILRKLGAELTPDRIEAVQKSLLMAIKGLESKGLVRVDTVAKGGVRAWTIC
jgi:hypothetical protein